MTSKTTSNEYGKCEYDNDVETLCMVGVFRTKIFEIGIQGLVDSAPTRLNLVGCLLETVFVSIQASGALDLRSPHLKDCREEAERRAAPRGGSGVPPTGLHPAALTAKPVQEAETRRSTNALAVFGSP